MMSLVRVKLSLDLSCVKVSLAGRIAFCHRDNSLLAYPLMLSSLLRYSWCPPFPPPPPHLGFSSLLRYSRRSTSSSSRGFTSCTQVSRVYVERRPGRVTSERVNSAQSMRHPLPAASGWL